MFQELLLTLYILSLVVGYFIFRPKKQKKSPINGNMPYYSHTELFDILNKTISDVIINKQEYEYKMKKLTMMYDFQEETIEITRSIYSSLSDSMIQQLEQFHTREYIMVYIGRVVKAYLIEYTRTNKIKTK